MDPDMVRQQEEAEQAARALAAQPQPPAPLMVREMPVPADPLAFLDPRPLASGAQATRAELEQLAPARAERAEAPLIETVEPVTMELPPVPAPAVPDPVIAHAVIADAVTADSAPLAPVRMPAPSVVPPPSPMPPAGPAQAEPLPASPARRTGALGDAALLCTAFAGAGIVGGLAVAAKMQMLGAGDQTSFTQLLAANGLVTGAVAGFVLGWLGAALKLRTHEIPTSSALRASFLPTIFVLIAEVSAAYVADTMPSAALYAAVIVSGGIIAFMLAYIGIVAGVSQRRPPPR